jgi:uncharacterized PurR-regulated membrane protein YhhQ (DUF165 family)
VVSQFIDSFVVLFIAFYVAPRITGNTMPWSLTLVMAICLGNYIYKFIVALAMTPVIYLVHGLIEKYLGKEETERMKQEAVNGSVRERKVRVVTVNSGETRTVK